MRSKVCQRCWRSLFGPQNHYGGLDGGHYTAYCKSALKQRWYKFDDHEVSDISTSSVKSSAAYILFYSTLWWSCWSRKRKHFAWAVMLRERGCLISLKIKSIRRPGRRGSKVTGHAHARKTTLERGGPTFAVDALLQQEVGFASAKTCILFVISMTRQMLLLLIFRP